MKEIFVCFAKQNEEADKAVVKILDGLGNEEREKGRKSYYGSLSALARHVMGGTRFFLGMMGKAVPGNAGAREALAPLAKATFPPEGKVKLSEAQWKAFTGVFKAVDKALVNFVSALGEGDFSAPVACPFYRGKPAAVPMFFMLQNLTAHGIHHRGQISQILDSLKIDNDYSAVNVKFLG
ncbi:MAG: DinB family/DNA damage-inducible protein DinB [Treponematales bacterium]